MEEGKKKRGRMPTLWLVAAEFWRDEVKPDRLPRVFGDAILLYYRLITMIVNACYYNFRRKFYYIYVHIILKKLKFFR